MFVESLDVLSRCFRAGKRTEEFKMENDAEMSSNDLDDESLQELYTWIDEIPLSRPKRNIARDFSDGGSDNRQNLTVWRFLKT